MRIACVVNKTFWLIFLSFQWGQFYCDISHISPTTDVRKNDQPTLDSQHDHNSNQYNEEPNIVIEKVAVQKNEKQIKLEVKENSKADVHEKPVDRDINENLETESTKQSEETNDQENTLSHASEGLFQNDGRRKTGSVAEAISTNDRLPKPVKTLKKVKVHGIKPKLDVLGCVPLEKPIFHEVQPSTLTKIPGGTKLQDKGSITTVNPVEESKGNGEDSISSHQELPESQIKDEALLSASAEVGHNAHSEAMPSFDEWKKMMLAEQSKDGLKIPSPGPPGKKITNQKRKRNYASYECGAKIVGSNPEAEGTSRILNELFDEYMLNPCKAKIWFVIELCEAVQALQIELANFELFSSCPKDFAVYSSDHYPTRDWIPLGTFQAQEQRVLQSFQLKQEGFGKFIKIELLSYYGREHYCPLSVVRMFGTSMVDEYEEMETAGNIPISQQDDDDDRDVHLDFGVVNGGSTNLFGSATDAVINIVKKAAQVLSRDQPSEGKGDSGKLGDQQNASESKPCKYFADSSESCSAVNGSDEENLSDSSLGPDFQMPYSSLHHSLFHYLHQCDSCISTPKKLQQSMAPPTCRFFKAALGPVLYQTVCNFLKDNPATSLTPDSQISGAKFGGKVLSETAARPTASRSPPPTVISVIIDGPIGSNSLPVHSGSFSTSDLLDPSESVPVSGTEMFHSSAPTLEGNSYISKLEDHIVKPTKTPQNTVSSVVLEASNSSVSAVPDVKLQGTSDSGLLANATHRSKIDAAQIISPSLESSSVTSVDKSSVLTDSSTTEAFSPSSETASATSGDQFLESYSNEFNDTAGEVNTKSENVTVLPVETAINAPDDFPEELKIADDKIPDIPKEDKDSVSKLDPNFSGSSLPVAGQKESVFMRMSNRIKALELNMSLSSQYLQELSQRYRRQMEEMQRAFNRTIGTLNDTARKAAERDIKQQEVIGSLQSQVANLTLTVELLMTERTSLYTKMIEAHVFLMIVEAIVMITILSLCVRRMSSSLPCGHVAQEMDSVALSPRSQIKRRNSVEMPTLPTCSKLMKRSVSEETLTSGQDLLIVEPTLPVLVEPPPKVKKKYTKRKKNLSRSASNPSLTQKNSIVTSSLQNTRNNIQDCKHQNVPFSHPVPHSLLDKVEEKLQVGCENCNVSASAKCTAITINCNTGLEREKRTYSSPLQNLTNGAVCKPIDAMGIRKGADAKDDRRFSIRKFLKIQKRDSV